jgi:outer membrane lipoprotein-sorting protein
VRLKFSYVVGVVLLGLVACAPRVAAQNPDTLMPEESTAKAKELLKDLVAAFGGAGYSDVRESQCHGRRALFGHNGELTGYIDFTDFRKYPDKQRVEFLSKGRNTILQSLIGLDGLDFAHGGIVITVYNGDHGWTYDKSGVNEMPASSVSDFQEQVKRNIDNLIRVRVNEPGMLLRYAGTDTVDLKQVDWVEITDPDQRVFKLALDHSTHLLLRSVIVTTDEEFHQLDQDVIKYSNYQLKDSVWTPLQVVREHNGRRTAQMFFDSCSFNPGFPDSLFTKDSLNKSGGDAVIKKAKSDKN